MHSLQDHARKVFRWKILQGLHFLARFLQGFIQEQDLSRIAFFLNQGLLLYIRIVCFSGIFEADFQSACFPFREKCPTTEVTVIFLQTTILTLIGPLFLQFLQS